MDMDFDDVADALATHSAAREALSSHDFEADAVARSTKNARIFVTDLENARDFAWMAREAAFEVVERLRNAPGRPQELIEATLAYERELEAERRAQQRLTEASDALIREEADGKRLAAERTMLERRAIAAERSARAVGAEPIDVDVSLMKRYVVEVAASRKPKTDEIEEIPRPIPVAAVEAPGMRWPTKRVQTAGDPPGIVTPKIHRRTSAAS